MNENSVDRRRFDKFWNETVFSMHDIAHRDVYDFYRTLLTHKNRDPRIVLLVHFAMVAAWLKTHPEKIRERIPARQLEPDTASFTEARAALEVLKKSPLEGLLGPLSAAADEILKRSMNLPQLPSEHEIAKGVAEAAIQTGDFRQFIAAITLLDAF